MRIVRFSRAQAVSIEDYQSLAASAVHIADGDGEAHAYCVYIEPGGSIGRHHAGFGQLFLVVQGSGWVAGADGRRVELRAGEGACFEPGEMHSKGSETGMTVLMFQVTELKPAEGAKAG